jgi:hypothetical protein
VVDVFFDGVICFLALFAFRFDKHDRIDNPSCLRPLFAFSRVVFIIYYILIMVSSWEYHVRFFLSLAQSFFGCVIAGVVIKIMCGPHCHRCRSQNGVLKQRRPASNHLVVVSNIDKKNFKLETIFNYNDNELSVQILFNGKPINNATNEKIHSMN